MRLNVTSEIGRLKSVLVHLPGREIDVMIPPMMTQLLFDDILYGQVAREEHRRFQQIIRFVAPEVLDIQDLMEDESGTSTIEGGDVLVASRKLLLVGVTQRTTKAAVRRLARSLQKAGAGVEKILAVELPKHRSFMHLDTVFTFTSRHECLIYPPVILPDGRQAASVYAIDLTKKSISFSPQKSLLGALRRRGFELEPIYCGGKRAVDQQREQWTDGANAFALAPGVILLYERNVRTAEELAAHG